MKTRKMVSILTAVAIVATCIFTSITAFATESILTDDLVAGIQTVSDYHEDEKTEDQKAKTDAEAFEELMAAMQTMMKQNETSEDGEAPSVMSLFFNKETLDEISKELTEELGDEGSCTVSLDGNRLMYEYTYNLDVQDDETRTFVKDLASKSFADAEKNLKSVIELLKTCLDFSDDEDKEDAEIVWVYKDQNDTEFFHKEISIYEKDDAVEEDPALDAEIAEEDTVDTADKTEDAVESAEIAD